MNVDMATVRMTEAELARDLHAVLAKVQQGVEVIVEQDDRAVALTQRASSNTLASESANERRRSP